MSIRIKKLSFVAGKKTGSNSLELSPGSITILVGPNNSGKSQALRDIEARCVNKKSHKSLVISEVEIQGCLNNFSDIKALFKPFNEINPDGEYVLRQEKYIDRPEYKRLPKNLIKKIHADESLIREHIIPLYLIKLDGRSRFRLVDPEKETQYKIIGSHLGLLKESLSSLNKIVKDVFGKYIVPQMSHYSNGIEEKMVRLKVSEIPPPFELMSRIRTNAYIINIENPYYEICELLTEQGDGIQAFVGIMSALLVRPQTIMLIDEPEAFLAPSIARRLGRELTKIAKKRSASLIFATHSADFVMGCVETSNDPKIVRLTYQNKEATAMEVPTETVREFNINPCLRSSSAIRGLFHKGVVVTEAHGDRVFYDELNHQLVRNNRGIEDVLFIDSGGGINQIVTPQVPQQPKLVP